jgi:hypothetical protein
MPTGQLDNLRSQPLLILPDQRKMPLGGTGLTDYPTDPPLGNTQLLPDVLHEAPPSVGAQKFPSRA